MISDIFKCAVTIGVLLLATSNKAQQPTGSIVQPRFAGVNFDKEKQLYKVTFNRNGKEVMMVYNQSRTINEMREKIPVAELPPEARSYLSTHHIKTVKQIYRYTKANGEIGYLVDALKKEFLFDAKGRYIIKPQGV